MEIFAKCKLDYEAIKALTHLSFGKRKDPKKQLILRMLFCGLLAAWIVTMMVVFGVDYIPVVLLVVDALIIAIYCMTYFALPRKQYKALKQRQNLENLYTFCDDMLKVTSKNACYDGKTEMQYSMLVKAMETSKYLFLYLDDQQVFMVDKATISGGTVGDIRARLLPVLGDRYILCNY